MVMPFSEAEEIFQAEKTLIQPMKWDSSSKSGRNQSCLECRVEIAESLPRGVLFRAIAYPRFLETFTFQLECERLEARAHITLYRLEVNPLKAHTNKFFGPEEIQGDFFPAGTTHEHDFHDGLTQDGQLRDNSCAQARRMTMPLPDFTTALGLVCSRINIVNGAQVPKPPSQGSLF